MNTIFTFQSLQITKDTQQGWLIKTNDPKTIFKPIASLEIDSLRTLSKINYPTTIPPDFKECVNVLYQSFQEAERLSKLTPVKREQERLKEPFKLKLEKPHSLYNIEQVYIQCVNYVWKVSVEGQSGPYTPVRRLSLEILHLLQTCLDDHETPSRFKDSVKKHYLLKLSKSNTRAPKENTTDRLNQKYMLLNQIVSKSFIHLNKVYADLGMCVVQTHPEIQLAFLLETGEKQTELFLNMDECLDHILERWY